MIFKTILFFILSFNLYALEQIKDSYLIDSHDINSSIFFKDKKNIKLYEIPKHKHSLRIKKQQLEKLLKTNGFKNFNIGSRYVHFELISPVDTKKIEDFLRKHYKKKYAHIDIQKIDVRPRSFMQTLPQTYTIDIRGRNYLSKDGVVSIEDSLNRKYFFDYNIDARINVLTSKAKIHRGEELSRYNCKIETIKLDKLRALPLQEMHSQKYQAKYNLKPQSIISIRDVKKLSLVKRDSQVSVFLNNSGVNISFSAKALQSGKLNDIITVQKSDGTRLKARVIAKQKVEIR